MSGWILNPGEPVRDVITTQSEEGQDCACDSERLFTAPLPPGPGPARVRGPAPPRGFMILDRAENSMRTCRF